MQVHCKRSRHKSWFQSSQLWVVSHNFTLDSLRGAKDSWCLHKLIHCGGENSVDYIITSECQFLECLTSKVVLETRNNILVSNWNESTLNHVGCCFYWNLFIHDGWVYTDATNPKPLKDSMYALYKQVYEFEPILQIKLFIFLWFATLLSTFILSHGDNNDNKKCSDVEIALVAITQSSRGS